jgi:hypothetical protein
MGVQTSEKLSCTRLVASEDMLRTMRYASLEGDGVDNEAGHAGRYQGGRRVEQRKEREQLL